MVSCNDIPERLIGSENFHSFTAWLGRNIPNRADRKALGKCWAEYSQVTLTRAQWFEILNIQGGQNDL